MTFAGEPAVGTSSEISQVLHGIKQACSHRCRGFVLHTDFREGVGSNLRDARVLMKPT